MIHQYKLGGYNIVLDVCSGGVHVVDDVAYDIIALFEEKAREEILLAMEEKYPEISPEDITECYAQVQSLKETGKLFAPDTFAREENCIALLEGIFREGKVHFLMGGDSGMLAWQQAGKGAEIVAIHTLPESHGTGLGAALLTEALNQIGSQTVFLCAFEKNARARCFYEKHGFRWDGSRRVSEFDGAIEVRYVK